MGILSYGMIVSLDGFVNGLDGDFDWAMPDEEIHSFANEVDSRIGTFLYGRRMFETMRAWADDGMLIDQPAAVREYATIWRAADKIIISSTIDDPGLPRTTVMRQFDPDVVRELKRTTERDLSVSGPMLAASMLQAGLVDELDLFVAPVVIGSGTAFFPPGLRLDLELLEWRRFASGMVYLRYAVVN